MRLAREVQQAHFVCSNWSFPIDNFQLLCRKNSAMINFSTRKIVLKCNAPFYGSSRTEWVLMQILMCAFMHRAYMALASVHRLFGMSRHEYVHARCIENLVFSAKYPYIPCVCGSTWETFHARILCFPVQSKIVLRNRNRVIAWLFPFTECRPEQHRLHL